MQALTGDPSATSSFFQFTFGMAVTGIIIKPWSIYLGNIELTSRGGAVRDFLPGGTGDAGSAPAYGGEGGSYQAGGDKAPLTGGYQTGGDAAPF